MDQTTDAMETDTASIRGDMEEDAGGAPATHIDQLQSQGQALDQARENVRSLLALARQLVDQGKPSFALQAVMATVRSQGGEHAVFQTLLRARELYRNKLQGNAAADELASLFAECAIAEAQPPNQPQPPPPQPPEGSIPPMLLDAVNDTSILTMSGRKQIMLDAFSDGSSFICLQCGGLVSNLRKDEHLAYWCGKD